MSEAPEQRRQPDEPGPTERLDAFEPAGGDGSAGAETIGRYKLRQKLGEGGCGVVYLAEQVEPVRRRVALKVIKLGMDTRAVLARFEAERQALALMEHPNIAKVFDAGTTAAGRPYFVMELVRGLRITDYCDQHNVSTQGRLGLFTQVCHAIQHAHQKGIIHRDIKPSNILVAVHDGVPVPKVIDFGIAKSIHGRLTEATVFTGFEQFIGTPAYMSPEQAELTGLDIDTRSDIYSLGVVLYELLAGRPPFDPRTLVEAGLDEIRRVIREVDPPRPSTRLTTLTDADSTTIARHRGTAPAQLGTLLRGDLDWIVMKSIEKQRARRYETADALALDIARHLRDEPVAARPPSTLYHLRKLVARHKVAVAAAAAVALALMVGTVVSTWQAVRARRAEHQAQRERSDARRRQEQAEDLLGFMLGDLRTQLQRVGRLDVLEAVGDKSMVYFASLDARDLNDATLARQAKALTQIGEIRMAQGKYPEAMQAFTTAYERAAALTQRNPENGDMHFDRAQAEYWIGFTHWRQGGFPAAQEWLTRYRDTAAALVAREPAQPRWRTELASGQHNLAVLRSERGELEAARADFLAKRATLQALLAADPGNTDLRFRITDTESWLGSLAERRGKLGEALEHFEAETRGLEALVAADPNTMRWRYELADGRSLRATILAITGRRTEAQRDLVEARKLLDALLAHDASNREWLISSHRLRLREAMLAWAMGQRPAAEAGVSAARTGLEAFVAAVPSSRPARALLAAAWREQAEISTGDDPAANERALTRAVELGDAIVSSGIATETHQFDFARTCVAAATQAATRGDTDRAKRLAERAWALLQPSLDASQDWRLLDSLVRALALLSRSEESRTLRTRLDAIGYQPLVPWPSAVAR